MPGLTFTVLLKGKQFFSSVCSKVLAREFLKSSLLVRLTAIILIFSLLAPMYYSGEFGKTKAQVNLPFQQPAPITAPPEPYLFSSGNYLANISPLLETIINPLSNSSSAVSTFLEGEKTPKGLGAATPPPTFKERFSGFLASVFSVSTTNNSSESTSNLSPPPSCSHLAFDFDGDCYADYGRWQANSFQYKIYNSGSSNYTSLNLGSSSSKIAPADFDGDGKFDLAVFSAGSWTVRKSSTNTDWNVSWGTSGDLPYPADYDGDGTADFAIYRPSTNTFWVLTSGSGYASYTSTALGNSGDVVVTGNYDGDSKADYAVFRPSNGNWYYLPSSGGSVVQTAWGVASDIPAPGDFDGDGKTDQTVFRPSTGTWYILKSTGGSPNYIQTNWGNLGDQPTTADYDGDGKSDMAIYRPTTGVWWVLKSYGGFANYTTFSLGTSSDTAVPSAFLKQSGAELLADQLSTTRLAPINATGGTNLYSRNFGWGQTLVSLPGRAGMNLGIGVGYNSLVWTKINSTVAFDVDHSNLAPGFNFGFPRIEPAYFSSQTSTLSYLMVSPSGGRTEFRQTTASDTYETADSSYAQIKVNNPGTSNSPTPIEDITLTVRGINGTQLNYAWIGGAYRCTKITDRNGNFITISNNSDGLLTSVTDTLGRVVIVNYDSYSRPSSITQNWQTTNGSGSNTTHTWASFAYTTKTVSTSFDSSLSVYGPANGTSITVLDKITYATGSYTKFSYNSYGQVYKISSYAQDNTLLNYEWKNINSPSSNQTDCPRFTQTKIFAANFNNGNEVTVNNTFTTGQSYTIPTSPTGTTLTGTRIEVKTPDSNGNADYLVTRIFSPSSGWAEGIPALTEDYATESSTLVKKRSVWSNYTQDDTSKSYIVNPRVVESKIGDNANTKRTTIDYLMQSGSSTVSQYGLVSKVKVYDTNQSTVLKTQTSDYITSSNYTSRRIIGLPSESKLYDGTDTSGTLVSKVTFDYDESGYAGTGQSVTATQHDATNFGTGFSYRGNQTRTRRWDVNYSTSDSYSVSSQVKYNITGSPISQTDPRNRVTTISYTDDWNDSVSRSATYAYPTTITDSGSNSSTVEYRYDFGANVWARSPVPYGTGNTYGKTSSRKYDDSTGRIEKEKIENSISGAYTRYVYSDNGASLDTYTTIIDANNDNTINGSDEVKTETLFDGAGRIRLTRTQDPQTGNYIGKRVEYNILGQVKRESVPTEINSSWNPTGDDYRGMDGSDYIWLWNSREYDWKGRVTKETNTDGTDRLYSYEGCGCAGNQVTTIKGEVTSAIDVSGTMQTTKRRTQKIYQDILGRTVKAEVWDLDGGGSTPYSTIVNTFNGRDQITNIREYSGSSSSSTYQDTTFSFDGHGRLISQHRPENFDASNSNAATYTAFTYKPDDTIATMTDPRGAVTTYYYGNVDDGTNSELRQLPTKIAFTSPNSSIPDPADISFSYDPAGNKTYMSDETGTTNYVYDELSQLKEETKNFADTLSNAPTGGYKLKYNYFLTGGLKSIEDPFNDSITYTVDKIGRITAINGSAFWDDYIEEYITSYASNINYRAFGGVKSMSLKTRDATNISLTYDTRLRPLNYKAELNSNSNDVQNSSYTYNNDGTVKEVINDVQANFSQYFDYDFVGRIKRNDFGTTTTGQPYKQTLGYDAFNNITSRTTKAWDFAQRNFTAGYTNNRKSSGGYQSGIDTFDAAGNVTQNVINSTNDLRKWKFDVAGRMSDWEESLPHENTVWDTGATLTFDGNGRAAKRLNRNRSRYGGNQTWIYTPEYTIFSSVTGQKITTLTEMGGKSATYIYMGGSIIATQGPGNGANNSNVNFQFSDPITGSEITNNVSGQTWDRKDNGALGIVVPPEEPEIMPMPNYKQGGSVANPETGCQLDYAPISCNLLTSAIRHFNVKDIIDTTRGSGVINFRLLEYTLLKYRPVTPQEPTKAPTFTFGGFDVVDSWYELYVWGDGINSHEQSHSGASNSASGNGNPSQEGEGQDGVSENCKNQVSLLGDDIWAKVEKLLKNPPLIDIDKLDRPFFGGNRFSQLLGEDYFGDYANQGETPAQTFDRETRGGYGALTIRGTGRTGIYYRSSRTNFSNKNFLLHEIMHLIYPQSLTGEVDLDEELVNALNIVRDPGQSYSDAVSRYFNSGCDPKYGGIFEESDEP